MIRSYLLLPRLCLWICYRSLCLEVMATDREIGYSIGQVQALPGIEDGRTLTIMALPPLIK